MVRKQSNCINFHKISFPSFNLVVTCLKVDTIVSLQGIITQEMVDSFNLPFYYPSPSELKSLIEVNGLFEIKKIEKLVSPTRQVKPDDLAVCVLHLRAILGELIKEHFGEGITDILFKRHTNKYVESPVVSDGRYFKETSYFVFLKRKMNCAS